MKSPLKSKTNLIQIPFVGILVGAMADPMIQELICTKGKFIVAAQVILTLIARNLKSDIKFKK